jgi:hypothetical protein
MVLTGALVGAAAYAVAGSSGLLVVTVLAGALALLLAHEWLTGAPAGRARPGQVGRVNAAFSSYWRIESALDEGRLSRLRFDRVTAPMLTRLLAALLADRQRVDLVKDPDAARKAIGDDVWPMLDPGRPPVTDSAVPGVTVAALTTIVDRLEEL